MRLRVPRSPCGYIMSVALGVSACGSSSERSAEKRDVAAAAPRVAEHANRTGAPFDTIAAVAAFSGCYELRSATLHTVVHLQSTRSGATWWQARDVQRENTPGDWWTWAPLDSSRFEIQWGGIDGALSYLVERQSAGLAGQETVSSVNRGGSATTHSVQVRPVRCHGATS
jgi:hypothetical protein